MTPCNDVGWRAVFFNSNFGDLATESVTVPVVAWLWVEHDDEEHAHPLVALSGDIVDATTVSNYLGVIAPGDTNGAAELLTAARPEIQEAVQKTA